MKGQTTSSARGLHLHLGNGELWALVAAVAYALTAGLPALRERRLSRRQWAALAVVAAALLASWTRLALLYVFRGEL